MNNLLVFFALPISTILISIVLQTVLKRPFLVALFAFGVYLIVTFAAFDANFLIFAIIYTLLAYLTAVITKFIIRLINCSETDDNIENESIVGNVLPTNIIQTVANPIEQVPNTYTTGISNNCGCRYKNRR